MPSRECSDITFYPAYCFHLSPTYNTWARLTIIDIDALRERQGFEGQNLYFHLNHPIRWARLVGVVVAFDILPTRFVFTIDDSSGATIEVTCGRPPITETPDLSAFRCDPAALHGVNLKGIGASGGEIDMAGIAVGTVVKLKGSIGTWWGNKQIMLERLWIIRTTTQEVEAWGETSAFHSKILDQPWIIDEKEQKRAKKLAERGYVAGKERRALEEKPAKDSNRKTTGHGQTKERKGAKLELEKRQLMKHSSKRREEVTRRKIEKRERERELEKRRLEQRQAYKLLSKQVEMDSCREAKKQEGLETSRVGGQSKSDITLGQQCCDVKAKTEKEVMRQRRDADRAERERIFAERLHSVVDRPQHA